MAKKRSPNTACEVSGREILDHFADVGKMVDIGSGAAECATRCANI